MKIPGDRLTKILKTRVTAVVVYCRITRLLLASDDSIASLPTLL